MIKIFKIILIAVALFGIGLKGFSQVDHTIHTGNFFKINPGTDIYFIGDYTDSSSLGVVINQGDMFFNGNITNNGLLNIFGSVSSDGRAHLIGATTTIDGSDEIVFHNLEINKDANTDIVNLNKFVIINDSLLISTGDMLLNDSLELKYVGGTPAVSSPGGVYSESNDNRIYGPSFIKVTNVDWSSVGMKTYQTLKNVGISLEVKDYLGANTPVIYRYNITQECGGNTGSIQRTFEFKDVTLSGEIDKISMKYHVPNELGSLPNGDSISVYYSNDDRDNWSDIGGAYGTSEVTNSDVVKQLNNLTYVTGAKDSCDYAPFIQFSQINYNVVPTDTLVAITNAQSCDSSDVSIQVIGDPGKYVWSLPSGSLLPSDSGVYHTFSDIGTYTLVLEDRRGCIAKKDLIVSSAPNGNSEFTAISASLCDGVQFDFVPDSANIGTYTYEWDLDNDGVFETSSYQISNHVFPSDGVHVVGLKVVTDIGCSVSSSEQYVIQPIPVAQFVPSSACPLSIINFDNNSTGQAMAGVDIFWDFDNDGGIDLTTSGNGQGIGGDATFSYATEGSYPVTITASSNGCNSLPFTTNVTVLPKPIASFTFTNACEGQQVQFTNTSTISDLSSLNYNWDFNSPIGPNSTLENPSFTYSTTNAYAVSLTSTSTNGCAHDTIITVDIDENPVAAFAFTNECINSAISFVDNSQVGNGSITTWSWDFDNGTIATNQNEVQSFVTAGNYDVALTVATGQGCAATITQSVTVFDGPLASYSAVDQCAGIAVNFSNTSTNAVSFQWSFPSVSQTSNSINPSLTFATPGWHVAELQATSANNCIGNFVDSIEVFPLPNIGLGASNTTCGTTFTLDASDGGNNAGASYFWNTGATTPQFNATYNGTFSVNVTSVNGCLANESTTVTLNSAVVPNISDQSECDLVVLDAGYTHPLTVYSWTGPSGFTATTQTINVTNIGTSSYSVTVIDQNGCSGTASANVVISTSSPVAFGPDQIKCVGDIVTLNAGTPGSTYDWNTLETSQSIDVTIDGFYFVELTNSAGCVSGDTIQVTFNTSPVIDLGNDSSYCVSHQLNAFSPNSSYVWNDMSVQPNLTIANSGQYFVEVTNTLTNCVAFDTIALIINPLPIVALGNDTILCSYQSLLIESGSTGVDYIWNSGAVTSDITVASTGLYSVEVTDANGCVNSDQINVTVNPIFTFDLGVDKPFCEGANVLLELDTVFAGAAYTWSNSSGILANTISYAVLDTGIVYLDIVNQNGCNAIDSINILPSNLSLHAVFLADSKVAIGDSIIFIDLSYPKPYTLEWDMGNGYTTTDSVPIFAYFVPDDYNVTLTVNNGFCESVRTKTITIEPIKSIEFEPEIPNLYSTIESVQLYPNPNNGDFNLKIKVSEESAIQVDIFNLLGQKLFNEKFIGQELTRNYSLNNLRPGVYIVRVMSGKDSQSVKFVKINN